MAFVTWTQELSTLRLPNGESAADLVDKEPVPSNNSNAARVYLITTEPGARSAIDIALTERKVPHVPSNAHTFYHHGMLWRTHAPIHQTLVTNSRTMEDSLTSHQDASPTPALAPGFLCLLHPSIAQELAHLQGVRFIGPLLPDWKIWGKARRCDFTTGAFFYLRAVFIEFLEPPSAEVSRRYTAIAQSNDPSARIFALPISSAEYPFHLVVLKFLQDADVSDAVISSIIKQLSELDTAVRVGFVSLEASSPEVYGYQPLIWAFAHRERVDGPSRRRELEQSEDEDELL